MVPTKTCSGCRSDLPLDSFSRRKDSRDGRQNRCRACWRRWYLENRQKHIADVTRRNALRTADNRQRLAAYLLANPCVDCGESDLRVLDFDHRDRELKRGVVSRMVFRASWVRLQQEIALCDVRCANCHRRRTAQQLGYWSALPVEPPST
jgi:hypothetical protein